MLWNTDLFLLVNAPASPGGATLLAVVALAASPALLAPVLLAACGFGAIRTGARPCSRSQRAYSSGRR